MQKQPPKVFYKKGVLKTSQNSQENTCARVSFSMKLQALSEHFFDKFLQRATSGGAINARPLDMNDHFQVLVR